MPIFFKGTRVHLEIVSDDLAYQALVKLSPFNATRLSRLKKREKNSAMNKEQVSSASSKNAPRNISPAGLARSRTLQKNAFSG